MQALSASLAAAYAAQVQYPDTVVDVVPRGADLSTPALATLTIAGGSADMDQTRPVRRQLQGLTVPVGGPNDALVPRKAGDLLHPVTGNELRVLYGRAHQGDNLLPTWQSDPPDGLAGWNSWVPIQRPGSNGWNGATATWLDASVKPGSGSVVVNATGFGWIEPGVPIAVIPGFSYVLVAWVMGLSGAVSGVGIGLEAFGTDGSYLNQAVTGDAPQSAWAPVVGTVVIPRTLGVTEAYLYVEPNSTATVAYSALGMFAGGPADATRTLTPTAEHSEVGYFGLQGTPQLVDTDGNLLLTLAGQDRIATLQRFRWTKPFQARGNTKIPDAIRMIVANRWPRAAIPLRVDFSACAGHPVMEQTIPNSVFGADHQGADPVGDIQALATAGQCEVYFGPDGRLLIVPYVQPGAAAPVLSFTDGQNAGAMVQLERDMDPAKVYNGVVVTGGNSTDKGVRGEWWDTDPSSPTYVETFGEVAAFWDTPLIRDPSQADAVARALGSRLRLGGEVLQLQTIPNGAYEGSDGMTVISDQDGVDGTYLLEKWSNLDLSESPKPMTITSRTTNQTFGEAVT